MQRLRCQRPTFEVEQLLLVSVCLDHDVFILADTFDLAHGSFKVKQQQIVKASQRNHEVKLLIIERIWLFCPTMEKEIFHLIVSTCEAML